MTTVAALLDRLRAAGVEVAVDGEKLILDGPAYALPDDVVALVRQHKAEVLETLRCPAPSASKARAALARRFVALEALLPRAAVDHVERWAAWRRLDRLLNEALAAGDLAEAERRIAEADRWACEAVSPAGPWTAALA